MARTFDGTDDQVAWGSDAATDQLSAFTAYALVRPTASILTERQFLTKMRSDFLGKMYLAADATDRFFTIVSRNGGNNAFASSVNNTLVANSWNVCVSTWDGSTEPVIYHCILGGTLTVVTNSGTDQAGSGAIDNDGTATLRLGARDPLDATFYAGGMADFGLWSRVLNGTELGDLGTGQSAEFITSGLVKASRITGTDSPEIDFVGGTNGTVTGTTFLAHPSVTYPGGGDPEGTLISGKLLGRGLLMGGVLVR